MERFRARFLRLFFLRGEANAGLADGSVCGKRSAKPDADLYGRPDAAHASGVRRPAAGRFVRLYLLFSRLNNYFSSADFVIANLETTLGEEPYSGYPRFRSPEALAGAMRRAGVDVAVLANNHICDRGAEGIRSTLAALDEAGLLHTGAFADSVPPREEASSDARKGSVPGRAAQLYLRNERLARSVPGVA